MAKKKGWRVLKEFDGRVMIENEHKQVLLSNDLTQEELAEMAENPIAAGFLENVFVENETKNEQSEKN